MSSADAPRQATLERLGPAAALLAWAAGAVPALTGEDLGPAPWRWWAAYLACGLLFAIASTPTLEQRPQLSRGLLVLQVITGLAAFVLVPTYGLAALLLVMNVASAAFLLGFRGALLLAGGQTAVVLVALVRFGSDPSTFAATEGVVYGGFQLFAAWAVELSLRERRARQQLAVLNAELAAAQARLTESTRVAERLRIARDLHDVVGHQLTALAVNLEVASHLADPPAAEHVARSRGIAKDLLADVRGVVGQMRDHAVDVAGALEVLAAAVPHPVIHVTVDDASRVDDPVQAEALLRCAQELVTNTVRHADADNLWIAVTRGPSGVVVRARDDGRGAEAVRPGNGLTGMRERLEHAGGELSYHSAPGGGFHVLARLPG